MDQSLVAHGDTIPEETVKEERGKSLGTKSLGTFLSFVFVINQIYGPGVLAIPLVYTQSGLFLTMLMLTFFLIVSSLSATCLAQAIASIPGNRQYQQRIEFGTAVAYYYGHKWHVIFQVCLNITLQAYNIASVVVCAQSIDQALVSATGHTWGFEFGPDFGFHSYDTSDLLYSSNHIAISVGYLLITLFFMPAGFMNLNDNVKTVQVGSFVFLILLMIEFIGFFIWRGAHEGFHSVPAFGDVYTQLVSVFIFSWAYVFFVPSWLNEKAVETSVNKVVWYAGAASWVGYIAIGWLCAAVFSNDAIGLDNMLVALTKNNMPMLTRITAYLFSLGVIAPGIPVCSVTTRYNLFVGGITSKRMSYFWACIAPWLVGWVFCQGEIFASFLNWTSLIFNGLVNFVVPFVMYLTSLKLQQTGGAPAHSPDLLRSPAVADSADSMESSMVDHSVDNVDDEDRLASLASAYSAPPTGSITSSSFKEPLLEQDYSAPADGNYVALGVAADRGDGLSRRFCAPAVADDAYHHGPVYPLPKSLRPYSYQIILGTLITTTVIIFAQTVLDLYYVAIDQNPLGS